MNYQLMRILHIIDSGGLYGKERMLLALVKEQSDAGHDVIVIGLGNKDFFEKCAELCYTYHVTHPSMIREHLIKIPYDIIHTHDYKTGILINIWNIFHDWKVVRTAHGYTGNNKQFYSRSRIYQTADKFMHKFNSATVAVSFTLQHELLSSAVYIDNGIAALDKYEVVELYEKIIDFMSDENSFVLMCAARASVEKNLHTLMNAIQLLNPPGEDSPSRKLVIFGDGPLLSELKVLEQEMPDKLLLAGFRSDSKYYLKYADAYIQPSHTEGMPISVLEAMSAEVQLIVSNVGGMTTLIEENAAIECGTTKQEIVNAIIRVTNVNTNDTMTRVQNALNLFTTRYSSQTMYRNYLKLYKSIL